MKILTDREKPKVGVLCRTFFVAEVRGISESKDGPFAISGKATVEIEDQHGTIIKLAGMDTSKFALNPVMRFMHDTPIGKWTEHQKTGDMLHVQGEISRTSLGLDVIQLVEDKAVKGLSISFYPLRIDYPAEIGSDESIIISESVLAEISIVDLPSNLEAWLNSADAGRPIALRIDEQLDDNIIQERNMKPEEIKALIAETLKPITERVDGIAASIDKLKEDRATDTEALKVLEGLDTKVAEIRETLDGIEFEEAPEEGNDDPESRSEKEEVEKDKPEDRDHGKPKGEGNESPDESDQTEVSEKMRRRLMSKQERDMEDREKS